MNGRVYDRELGRFLSADSFIQNPSDLQSLNRYSYVQNNPLSFTDPTGHFLSGLFNTLGHFFTQAWHAVTGAIQKTLKNSLIRAVIQIALCIGDTPIGCAITAAELSLASGQTPGQAFMAFTQTFISTGIWGPTGTALKGGGALTQILVHGAVQGALSLSQGGNFFQGFAIGAISEVATVETRGLNKVLRLAAVSAVGGFVSHLTGGKFANGAVSAAFAFLYNENGEGHQGPQQAQVCVLDGWTSRPMEGLFAPDAGAVKDTLSPLDFLTGGVSAGVRGLASALTRESVWSLAPAARGAAIEQSLGANLPANFPVIDQFANGIATSIKSIDLNAASYQSASVLTSTLTRFVDSVAEFSGRTWAGVTVEGSEITGRALTVAVPNAGTAAQQAAINQAIGYGAQRGVGVTVMQVP